MSEEKSVRARLRAFRDEVGSVGFDSTGQVGKRSYRYVTLLHLLEIVTPVLTKHGLILHQAVTIDGVLTEITDEKGLNTLSSVVPINYAGMNSQEIGSAITYSRRYGAFTLLGLVADEDDDGSAASRLPAQQAPRSTGNNDLVVGEPAAPEGWGSAKASATAHTTLSDRIGKLDAVQRSICSEYREANGGWPLAKAKFDELSAIVTTMEAGLMNEETDGKF
jgi:hypothetical protein